MKSLCFHFFLIDSESLIARDLRRRILPFCPEIPYDHKSYKIIMKATHFHVPA